MSTLTAYLKLMRFHKPIGIYLLLWPTLWGLWTAARGLPRLDVLAVFVLGTILMRAAGCIINDIADRKFDGFVDRTKNRPLVTGDVSVRGALILFIILCVLSFCLVLTLNLLTIVLAFIGLGLAVLYPFCKRFLNLPQGILGLAFAWGIPMGFAAELNSIPWIAWWVFEITVLFIIMYDTQYAMVDINDDIKINIKSSAILFGQFDKKIILLLQILVLSQLIVLGLYLKLNLVYFSFCLIALLLFAYQNRLIKNRDRANCFKAFLNNHWVGLVILLGLVIGFH